MDARVKLIVTLALLAMVLSYREIMFPLVVAAISFVLCLNMRIPARILVLRMAQPLFLAIVILLLKLFFSGKDAMFVISLPTSHFSLFTLTGHRDGLIEGIRIMSRIVGGVSLVVILGFATPFIEFTAALSWLRVPRPFIEIMMFAYRYLFMFLEDAMTIYSAQKNRLGYSTMRRGLSSFGVLAGSLTLKAFDHSHNTTVAMVQRGYDGNMPLLKHKAFKLNEVAVSIIFMACMGLLWRM